MEKKTPKVWEKIVTKIWWSTIQVLIKELKEIEWGYWYKWVIKWYDKSDYGKTDARTQEKQKNMFHDITIEWYMDEYGNRWDN